MGEFVTASYGGSVELSETNSDKKGTNRGLMTEEKEKQPLLQDSETKTRAAPFQRQLAVDVYNSYQNVSVPEEHVDMNGIEQLDQDTEEYMIGFEVGILYKFNPSSALPQFYLYKSMDLTQRFIAIVKEPTLVLVLERQNLFTFVNCSGQNGWIYLTHSLVEDRRIFRPILSPSRESTRHAHHQSCTESLYCCIIGNKTSASSSSNQRNKGKLGGRKRIEPLRYYHQYEDWQGKNSFLLSGRLMLGRDDLFFYGVLTAMIISVLPFFFRVLPELRPERSAKIWTVSG